ncbi:MAG TPA: hypothetical protein VF332_13675 [Vicinamibacterales bacterium]
MFCHEGPWHELDRIWTIRTDGTGLTRQHTRQIDMEIAGHEFFSADGRTIWYDLQTPKSEVFWLAGVDLATNHRTRYAVARAHWSVHFNVSPDGKLFAGDGGGPHSVAAPGNGQWIYLFTPGPIGLTATPLVDLSAHDYGLEPNVSFTLDGRWAREPALPGLCPQPGGPVRLRPASPRIASPVVPGRPNRSGSDFAVSQAVQ